MGIKPGRIADELLNQFTTADGISTLRYWRGDFYRWDGSRHQRVPTLEFRSQILQMLKSHSEIWESINGYVLTDVLSHLGSLTLVNSEITPPAWFDGRPAARFISCQNGLLHLPANGLRDLIPHSALHFNLASIPHRYDPVSTCPRWCEFLNEMLPDPGLQAVLQEWFGYNLTFDTSHEKMALFVGEGANGKTVCCVVLCALLGRDNVSAVGLEAFNPNRTFPLAETEGKLANICEELNEIERTSEGELKKFITGALMTVERKHRDPFHLRPSARLTFASNVLPRFIDRSHGIWRRILPIPFKKQILDETKQDRRLITPTYWLESGEMPGILNWALAGLDRLSQYGRFSDAAAMKEELEEFKKACNPAKVFLEDHYEESTAHNVPARTLYKAYSEYMRDTGQHPLREQQFSEEVRRVFPIADLTKNPRRVNGTRTRLWFGIRERKGD